MKLSQLQYFQAVCKYNNVTRAAEELHITQPSVSNAIRELEAEFGVNLFHRLNKRLTLTKEGDCFLAGVNEILKKSENLSQKMRDFGNKKNNIKIGVPPMIGTFLFPSMFRNFRGQNPNINLEILEYGSLHTIELVENESLDIAIVITNGINGRFQTLNIMNTQVLCCVSPAHKLAKCSAVNVNMLKDEPLVLLKEDSYQNNIITNRFKREDLVPNIILHSSQLYTLKNFASKNIAAAFLFKEIVNGTDDIIGIPFEPSIDISIGLIWKQDKYIYSDTAKFIQFTQQYKY